MPIVQVALDVPVATLFDYSASDATDADIGRRVVVPFGKKAMVGVIMGVAAATTLEPGRIRAVLRILRDTPPLPADLIELLRFCSDYYHHPIGEVVLNALPTRLRRRQPITQRIQYRYFLTEAGRLIDPLTLRRGTVKRTLVERLQVRSGMLEADLRVISERVPATLMQMISEGSALRVAEPTAPDPVPGSSGSKPEYVLTDEQRIALEPMRDSLKHFAPWLLLGITGSGKTEVYLELMAGLVAEGRQALLLVPEINLTPQLEARVRARFPGMVLASLHSGMSESERLHNWLAASSGVARVVLGTRLAVFAPLPNLGLIVVDEEQDTSFKQMEGLRYSARDLAVVRAKQRGVPVVLGSATPALETFHHALNGRYGLARLTRRINATLPAIACIDMRKESVIDGLTQSLLRAISHTMQRGEQSLIFINRRGYAPVLICAGCSWIPGCDRCAAKLVVHLKSGRLRCHHCGHQERIPISCPECGNQDLAPLGQGTQRIESALERIFPTARILRIDRDTTRRKNAWAEMRSKITKLEVDILVGTQILAKGHDFPQLNLVGVVNADNSLYSSDFRASEHLFARLVQVAGRAGRGERPGAVLIQTEFPTHPLYAALQRHDYDAFARELLAEREQAGFPPFVFQAVLRAESAHQKAALEFLADAARAGAHFAEDVAIYDPVPARMPRLAGLERAQLTLQSPSRAALHRFLTTWRSHLAAIAPHKVRWLLDVDPLEI